MAEVGAQQVAHALRDAREGGVRVAAVRQRAARVVLHGALVGADVVVAVPAAAAAAAGGAVAHLGAYEERVFDDAVFGPVACEAAEEDGLAAGEDELAAREAGFLVAGAGLVRE